MDLGRATNYEMLNQVQYDGCRSDSVTNYETLNRACELTGVNQRHNSFAANSA